MKDVEALRSACLASTPSEQAPEGPLLSHLLLNQLPLGVFHKDLQGRYIFLNSWLCHLHEMPLEEFLGRTGDEVAARIRARNDCDHPVRLRELRILSDCARHHALILQNERTIETDECCVDSDGNERFLRVTKGPLYSSEGAIIGSQGVLFDITDRKRAEVQFTKESDLCER